MQKHRALTLAFAVFLITVTVLGWIPALADANGKLFGVFRLTWYNDILHLASASWALAAAFLSRSASIFFLRIFGALYLSDGLMGLAIGSGYLDLGVVFHGIQDLPFGFKLLANGPHIIAGSIALAAGFLWSAGREQPPA
ncbi:MAG TPA: DUF4383 domain-containing protein [Alphaproteobacteria bacterium]|jgi:hypothetical protein|nr:DUF4383 domain-containing protein [Alphaproteobacteria bacterium]